MKTILVRYKIRDTAVAENEELIHAVFDELRASAPQGLRYSTFKLADGSTFVHLAMIDTADGSNPLVALDSFKRFQQGLPERCVEPPVASDLVAVDGYGMPGSDRTA
jgi:hypothetical protein